MSPAEAHEGHDGQGAALTAVSTGAAASGPQLFGHPAGLVVLCAAEMGERFSFYGMRALLILYMTLEVLPHGVSAVAGLSVFARLLVSGAPGDPGATASMVYGFYSSLVYFTPLLGGWLADRFFGRDAMVLVGGGLILAGHIALAADPALLLVALILIVLGTGGLKGNILAQVGGLYPPADPARERGFAIFYVFINIGATSAPILCALVASRWGWVRAFDLTAASMAMAMLAYLCGRRFVVKVEQQVAHVTTTTPVTRNERGDLFRLLGISLSSVLVWTAFEQQGNALMRWMAGHHGDVSLSWVQAVPPLVVITGLPLLTRIWAWRARAGHEPDAMRKIVTGTGIMALAQGLLVVFAATGSGSLSLAGAVTYLALCEVGDLWFSPAAMGLFSRLAPPRHASFVMAGWYCTVFIGNLFSGWMGQFWTRIPAVSYWSLVMAASALGWAGMALSRRYLFELDTT